MKIYSKNNIRTVLLNKLRNQKEVKRLKKSFVIQKKLFGLSDFIKAKTILFYMSFNGEVETLRMVDAALALGKNVAVPIIKRRTKKLKPYSITDSNYVLEVGPYSIYQPVSRHRKLISRDKLDLVIVPGVAFDTDGNRIGRGAGYYDRFLNSLHSKISSVGLAFDFQILPRLSCVKDYDFPVNKVLFA